jgi:hypothetical protein
VVTGVYNLTVNGTGTPGNRSTPLTLTVTSSGGGSIGWNYANCPVSQRPVWLAVQDGSGPWTVITPVNNVYSFNIASSRGGITYVLAPTASTSTVLVQYYSQAEFGTGTIDRCPVGGTLKTVNGTVAGVGATEAAFVSLGGGAAFLYSSLVGFPNFQLTTVQSGSQDLVASHLPAITGVVADKAIIQRGLNIANNGSVGTLDFTSGAFTLDNATIAISGLVGGEQVTHSMTYNVANCVGAILYNAVTGTGSSYTAAGVPPSQQAANDFHGFSLFVHDPVANMTRTTSQFYRAFGARTLALAALFPTPTVTSLGGPYKRLQAAYTLPADYQQSTSLQYVDQVATGKSVAMQATAGYLGGTAVTLALADYSGLANWDNTWAPGATNTASWTVSGSGGNVINTTLCSEGARVDFGQVRGTN